jgi:glutamyl-tRNA reductase
VTVGNWQLVLCGISHKTASLEQRESVQIAREELPSANACLRSLPELSESLVLSTCNRIEFYCILDSARDPLDAIAEFYAKFRSLDAAPVRGLFYVKEGMAAAEHLFRVAAGIDSMVLGENQILGQVKEAYSSACAVQGAGKILHRLFHQAFRIGKQVRTDTEMGRGACSVSSAAVEMLSHKIAAIAAPSILFIGANQMIGLAAMKLARVECVRLAFANRSPAKAAHLAAKFGGEGHGIDRLTDLMADADVVISCTSSPGPVISRRMLDEQCGRRKRGRCVLMDLAIPRDIDCEHKCGDGYEVFDLEDVKRFVESQQNRRADAIPQAEEIIDHRLREFAYWYEHVQHEPVYCGNGRALESVCREELAPLIQKLTPELRAELERTSRRLVERVLQITRHPSSEQEW